MRQDFLVQKFSGTPLTNSAVWPLVTVGGKSSYLVLINIINYPLLKLNYFVL